ncbi:MAG: lactonase family protein [Bacteroidales bacterium]|jgi:6-phosphogluconolactonase
MNRIAFIQHFGLGALGVSVIQKQAMVSLFAPETMTDRLYIGSYTDLPGQGITICHFDSQSRSIQPDAVCGSKNPSFLVFGNQRKFLYAVNETADFGGKNSGSVNSFACDEKTGRLTFLNSQPSLGASPCHLTLDRTGKFILVANYMGGNVAVLPVLPDGKVGEPVEMVQHTGSGINKSRQEVPHAHSVNLSPDNRFAFVCDLGIDRIMVYQFNHQTGKLTAAGTPWFQTAPGAGPRHFTFSADGKHAFAVNELNSTLTLFSYDGPRGKLTELQTVTTLPENFTGENTCADVHLHPNGRFVFASNRGNDSIAVFSINREAGTLKLIQNQSTLGKTPRNFVIHPSGRFLLAANQNSNSVHVFSLDPGTAKLAPAGKSISIDKPVCLLF